MIIKEDKIIEHFPTTIERESSSTLILKFPAYDLYEENKLVFRPCDR